MNGYELKRAGKRNIFASLLALVVCLVFTSALAQTNHYMQASFAEVRPVRLELEQPLYQAELQIRVSDYSANAHQMTNVTCDIYFVDEKGKESKRGSATLKLESPASDIYSGRFSREKEFTHGTVAKVSYKSPALTLPISTWYTMTFH